MESLVCSPLPAYRGCKTAAKDVLKDATPSERSTEEFMEEAGDKREEDSTVSTEEQGDSSEPMDSSFNDYYFMPLPIDDYYLSVDEPLDYGPRETESISDKSASRKTGEDCSRNPDQSESLLENTEDSPQFAAPPESVFDKSAAKETGEDCSRNPDQSESLLENTEASSQVVAPPGSSFKEEIREDAEETDPAAAPLEKKSEQELTNLPDLGSFSWENTVGSFLEKEETTLVKEEISPAESLVRPFKEEAPAETLSEDDLQTAYETSEEDNAAETEGPSTSHLTSDAVAKIWKLATKLCEARSMYNANHCRRKPSVLRQPRKKAPGRLQIRAKPVEVDPMTNNGVCKIGKGHDWNDPPEWDWEQPLPEEIIQVIAENIPSINPVNASSIGLFDGARTTASSSLRVSGPSLATSIVDLASFSKSSEAITLDSDDELPDFSSELGLPKKVGHVPEACYDVADTSCTVIAVHPLNLAPATRMGRKRGLARSTPNRNPNEVITLSSSDDSDCEVEVVSVSKKPAPSKAPDPEKPKVVVPDDSSRNQWSCPICFETKDKVQGTMSTICGHIFCGPCLQSTVRINKQCPTCRRKLTLKQIHNLYL